ncbi:hypothetical protein AVEN_235274-1 [Araneus ventricosus]|uniref:Uncharacterized protein n=1 Tax=Araneus ventricosus TaxID=182803 RepID=A0A4Y2A412_ARAVE|nr:hypothetical protein AVEN_235274-1 [Araneus ventricosus]
MKLILNRSLATVCGPVTCNELPLRHLFRTWIKPQLGKPDWRNKKIIGRMREAICSFIHDNRKHLCEVTNKKDLSTDQLLTYMEICEVINCDIQKSVEDKSWKSLPLKVAQNREQILRFNVDQKIHPRLYYINDIHTKSMRLCVQGQRTDHNL